MLRSPSVGARYGGSAAAAATAVAGEQSSGAVVIAVGDDGSPVPTVGFVTGMPGSVMEAGESKVRRESKTRQETPSSLICDGAILQLLKRWWFYQDRHGTDACKAEGRKRGGGGVPFVLCHIAPLSAAAGNRYRVVMMRWSLACRAGHGSIVSESP